MSRLVDRAPVVAPERLVAGMVPPPRFDGARFSTYEPDPAQPSQAVFYEDEGFKGRSLTLDAALVLAPCGESWAIVSFMLLIPFLAGRRLIPPT